VLDLLLNRSFVVLCRHFWKGAFAFVTYLAIAVLLGVDASGWWKVENGKWKLQWRRPNYYLPSIFVIIMVMFYF